MRSFSVVHKDQSCPWTNTVYWYGPIMFLSMLFIGCGHSDSSLLLLTALFTVSGFFVDRMVLDLISRAEYFLFLERCGTLACFPPPVGVLRDAQGEPGESGEPSGGAAWFHSVKSLLDINDGIVCSHNELRVRLLSNVFGTVALVGASRWK